MSQNLAKKVRLNEEEWTRDGWCDDTWCHHDPLGLSSLPVGFGGLSLFAGCEQLDDEDSSSTNDALPLPVGASDGGVIYSSTEGRDEVAFVSALFRKGLPPASHFGEHVKVILETHGSLPHPGPAAGAPTLVLDLDETLVHSSVLPIACPEFVFPVQLEGNEFTVYGRKRPHCDEFLRRCHAMGWEIVVFTASQRMYADRVLDFLDPSGTLLRHRLFREHCVGHAGNFLKHLAVLQRDLSRTVIVDNSPAAFALHMENGIPIESWYDDDADVELPKILGLLNLLAATPGDLRPVLKSYLEAETDL